MRPSKPPSERRIIHDAVGALIARLPAGWSAQARLGVPGVDNPAIRLDAVVVVRSPDGQAARIVIEAKQRIAPGAAPGVAEQAKQYCAAFDDSAVPVVGAGYLSPRARSMLASLGVGYIDTTGNMQLEVSSPGLAVFAAGAERDPWPPDARLASLRGRGAAVALRAIIAKRPPFGTRELAEATKASAPTLSRVIGLLEHEGIATREPRGPVLTVDWQAAIRRWAEDYGQLTSHQPTTLLDPRGLRAAESRLRHASFAYAATGAFAAQRFNPIAPARTASLYVEDPVEAAAELDLREVDSGANVTLLEPFDPVVFEGTDARDGLECVAPSQLAVDLLTGPGREPAQGEELLQWMQDNEPAWRT